MKTKRFNSFCILLIITTLFTACNNKQNLKPNPSSQWVNIQSWSFSGKMAINDGQNSGSGRIKWSVNNNKITAKFKALLGQSSWTIIEDLNTAKLVSSRNGETSANNATDLISNELGWHFPWDSLKYWVRGYQTNHPVSSRSTLPTTFNDNGWKITFQKWMKTPIGMLPKKIKASKDNYTVKLIVYKWDITPQ